MQLIKGFKDILPEEAAAWQYIEELARKIFDDFGFSEIRPPVMEKAELFKKSIGEATDIVEKEMYTFADRGGEQVTLRPEATASVVRAYIQHRMYAENPVQKLYTIGPMFRRERPQKGRYRQFHQINAEVFGVSAPQVDVQLILMLMTLFSRLAVSNLSVHLNSLGCRDCRPGYKKALEDFLKGQADNLCEDCRQRLSRNPLRVLDCKEEQCRQIAGGGPALTDYLCDGCAAHFQTVTGHLSRLKIPYEIDKHLVRGLDYYTRTTFEVQTGQLGAQNAIAGGGRYDDLVSLLGGPDQPAVGFAIGCERLVELVARAPSPPAKRGVDLFIAALGEAAMEKAFCWMCELNLSGLRAEMDFANRSLKSQMKQANRAGAARTLIVGEDELNKGRAVLRDMTTREQTEIPVDRPVERIMTIFQDQVKE